MREVFNLVRLWKPALTLCLSLVPDTLFGQPHPLREDPADLEECVLPDFGRAIVNEGEGSVGVDGEV
jgi:hypothetical protein